MMLCITLFVNRFVIARTRWGCLVHLKFLHVNSFLLLGLLLLVAAALPIHMSPLIFIFPTSMVPASAVALASVMVLVAVVAPRSIRVRSILIVVSFRGGGFRLVPDEGWNWVTDLTSKVRVKGEPCCKDLTMVNNQTRTYRSSVLEELNLLSDQYGCLPFLFQAALDSNDYLVQILVDVLAWMNPNVGPSRLLWDLLNHAATSTNDLSDQVAWYHQSKGVILEILFRFSIAVIEAFDEMLNRDNDILEGSSQFLYDC